MAELSRRKLSKFVKLLTDLSPHRRAFQSKKERRFGLERVVFADRRGGGIIRHNYGILVAKIPHGLYSPCIRGAPVKLGSTKLQV